VAAVTPVKWSYMSAPLLVQSDARRLPLADESVHCCVTSPPYWRHRDYGVEGQFGQEALHDCAGWATGERCGQCFVCRLTATFAEVRRVLRRDGTLWVVIGDSFASGGRGWGDRFGCMPETMVGSGWKSPPEWLAHKDLVGIPWRFAFSLQADGWRLRQCNIYEKPAGMPESTKDRTTTAHEYVFMFTRRSCDYYYDAYAIREPCVDPEANPQGKNRRSVWRVPPERFGGAHYATYPEALAERMILAGTSDQGVCPRPGCRAPWVREYERRETEDTGASTGGDPDREDGGHRERDKTGTGGNRLATRWVGTNRWNPGCSCEAGAPVPAVVLDPFAGSGTTGVAAARNRRRAILCELKRDYLVGPAKSRLRGLQVELMLG